MAQRATPATKSASVKPQTGGQKGTVAVAVAPRRARRDPVDVIWNLFCSIRFAVVLNVSLALAAMLGTIIPQMQPGIQNFEVELNQFLEAARGRYGDISGLLYWAGFYGLYNSLWFRMLVMVVVFSIIICTLNRWQPVMRLINEPTVRVNDAFLQGLTEKAQFRAVPVDQAQAHEALRASLKRSRYRVLMEKTPDGSAMHLYADRDRWSKLVTFVSHAALVTLILVAAGIASFGWREQSVYFYPGEPVNVGHGTDFSVRNDGFSIDYYADGVTVKEYKNRLAVIEDGKEVLTKTIIVNDPLQYKGVNFFLVSYQPVLYATALDGSGRAAGLRRMGASGPITDTTPSGEAVVDFSFTSPDNLPMDLLQLPAGEQIVTLEMTYYQDVARGAGENPPVYVRAFVDKEFEKPIYDAFLPRTGPFRVPGFEQYSFTFRKDTTTVLEVAKDPGLLYVGIFFGIMTLGFTLSLYTTFTRCWAKIAPSEEKPGTVNITLGGLAEKNKVTFERDFERLATRVRDALAKAAAK
ncbi:MAG TPA: cytochrome c biogenesis protein ResB [Chloroflexia bacterium]|jgi:cytochrome c biogenesis protein